MLIAVAINKLNTRRLEGLARKLSGSTQPGRTRHEGTTIPPEIQQSGLPLADDQVDVCLKPGDDHKTANQGDYRVGLGLASPKIWSLAGRKNPANSGDQHNARKQFTRRVAG